MVISDRYGFVFLRIPKNASTSLATFFVQNFCDQSDRYTGIGDSKTPTNNIDSSIIEKYRHQHRFIHLTLQEIIDEGILHPDELKNKPVIGVIRNPLERQLSLFFFKNRRSSTKTVEDFRRQFRNGYHEDDGSNRILQTDYPVYNGKTHGSFWKYDNLDYHLDKFMKETGVTIQHPIQSFKSKYKSGNYDSLISEYYDKDTQLAVENYYQKDFEVYENV